MTRLACCAFFLAVAATESFGQVYDTPYVSANAYVQASFIGPTDHPLVTASYDTGFVGFSSSSPSADAHLRLDESRDDVFGMHYHVISEAEFLATPGLLHARVYSYASLSQDGSLSTNAASQAKFATLVPTNPGATFLDTLTLDGAHVGDVVPLTMNIQFEGATSMTGVDAGSSSTALDSQGTLTVISTADGASASLFAQGSRGSAAPFHETNSFTTWVTVGTPFQISGNLWAQTSASRQAYPGFAESIFDALDTGMVTIDVPTGYTLSSASGHSYATPEPSTLLLLAGCVLPLLIRRRRAS
jgi:hypothetical protein